MASNDNFGNLLGEWRRNKALYIALAGAVGFALFTAVYALL